MKFSVQFLLALTLLSAVAINGWLTRGKSRSVKQEVERLDEAYRVALPSAVKNFAEKKLAFEQYLASYEDALEKLDRRREDFRLGAESIPMDVDNPDKIYASRFSTYALIQAENQNRQQRLDLIPDGEIGFQIHIPEPGGLLKVFARSKNYRSKGEILETSKFFMPRWPWESRLASGASTIKLVWQDEQGMGVLSVNGSPVLNVDAVYGEFQCRFESGDTKSSSRELLLFSIDRKDGAGGERLEFVIETGGKKENP